MVTLLMHIVGKMNGITEMSRNKCFGGWQKVFTHESKELSCKMKFAVFLPPQSEEGKVPVIYWLSGMGCSEQDFITKVGAQRYAAEHGVIIVVPDTAPKPEEEGPGFFASLGLGGKVEEESDEDSSEASDEPLDFSGFYIDASQRKYKDNHKMYSYITVELPHIINAYFPVEPGKQSIMGHGMGGHGALAIFLKNPGSFKSVSAFAPICDPLNHTPCQRVVQELLGSQRNADKEYDLNLLAKKFYGLPSLILIDQGKDDDFLMKKDSSVVELTVGVSPDNFIASCAAVKIPVITRMQDGYDHSYYFINSFIGDHIAHHAKHLKP